MEQVEWVVVLTFSARITGKGSELQLLPFVRPTLVITWVLLSLFSVRSHLKVFLEQSINDCAAELKAKIVDAQKVRDHFSKVRVGT